MVAMISVTFWSYDMFPGGPELPIEIRIPASFVGGRAQHCHLQPNDSKPSHYELIA
jgi:hypothetical protein